MKHLSFKILTLCSLFFSVAPFAYAQERPVNFTYKGYTAGLLAAKVNGTLDTTNDRFLLSLSAGDAGISSILSWASRIDASGVMVPQGVAPQNFSLQNRRKKKSTTRSLTYSGGIANTSFGTPPYIPDHEIIDPSRTYGTVDPATAFMAVLNTVDLTGNCNISIEVFEGKSLYRFDIRGAGTARVSDRNAAYRGNAVRCRIDPVPLAGKATRPKTRGRMTTVDMWIAKPVANGPMVPVKMTATVQGIPLSLVLTAIN